MCGRALLPSSCAGAPHWVFEGDFFQLPPVGLGKVPSVCFAFQTQAWREAVNRVVVLRRVFRQKEDDFVRILQEVRDGEVSPRTNHVLLGLSTATLTSAPGIEPTRLYARNRDVDAMNNERLIQLPGEETTFRAKDWGARPELSMLQRNCPAPETLTLKKDTQVILLKNLDPANGLVNGTRGVVIDFRAPDLVRACTCTGGPGAAHRRLTRAPLRLERGGGRRQPRPDAPAARGQVPRKPGADAGAQARPGVVDGGGRRPEEGGAQAGAPEACADTLAPCTRRGCGRVHLPPRLTFPLRAFPLPATARPGPSASTRARA